MRAEAVAKSIQLVQVSVKATDPAQNLAQLADAQSLMQRLAQWGEPTEADRMRSARILFWIGHVHFFAQRITQSKGIFSTGVGSHARQRRLQRIGGSYPRHAGADAHTSRTVRSSHDLVGASRRAIGERGEPVHLDCRCGALGLTRAARGEYALGLAQGQLALARAQETRDPRDIGWSQNTLSQIYWRGGDMPRALEASRAGMEIAEEAGDRVSVFVGAILAGWAGSSLTQRTEAAAHLAQATALEQLFGGKLAMSDRLPVAEAEIPLNRSPQDALMVAEQAVAQAQTIGSIYAKGMAQRVWGEALARLDPTR